MLCAVQGLQFTTLALISALEQNSIGWTMWDYQGGFGGVYKKDASTTEDADVLKALGLR